MSKSDNGWDERREFAPLPASMEYPPPSATVQVVFGAHSRAGRHREINEDHYLVMRVGRHQDTIMTSLPDTSVATRFEEYGYAMVVADGLSASGRGGGEGASHLAIATLVYLVRHFGKWQLRVDDVTARDIMSRVERFYRHVDVTMRHRQATGSGNEDQTTLTATFGAGRDLFFAHVGHSRAYLQRGGHLMRLTRDHTLGPRQSRSLPIAPLIDVNASARDLAHILTNTIGMRGTMGPLIDIERFQLADNDRVLVCTNGITDMLDEDQIGEVLATDESPDYQCRALVDHAMAAGGGDDATAMIARYRIPE